MYLLTSIAEESDEPPDVGITGLDVLGTVWDQHSSLETFQTALALQPKLLDPEAGDPWLIGVASMCVHRWGHRQLFFLMWVSLPTEAGNRTTRLLPAQNPHFHNKLVGQTKIRSRAHGDDLEAMKKFSWPLSLPAYERKGVERQQVPGCGSAQLHHSHSLWEESRRTKTQISGGPTLWQSPQSPGNGAKGKL